MSISTRVRPWVGQMLLVVLIFFNIVCGLYLVHLWQTKPMVIESTREHCIYAFPVEHVILIDAPRALCSGEEERLTIRIGGEEHVLASESKFGSERLVFFVPLKLGWATCFQVDIPKESGLAVGISPFDPSGMLGVWRGLFFFAWLSSLFVVLALARLKRG